ncbi:MAG: hypothetical protein PHQ01_03845 [Candidatus Pacebacteria bacterium]|nr:hypothetical protein [Candidatus Paceibacterota bacterium]
MFKNDKKLLVLFFLFIFLASINIFKTENTVLALKDTTPPIATLENYTKDTIDVYKVTANEALSYLKVGISSDLYVLLSKDLDSVWNMEVKKDGGTFLFVDVFKNSNDYSLNYAGSVAKLIKNKDETQFVLEVSGPITKQLRAQKNVPVLVKDVVENETSLNFNNNIKGSFNDSPIDHPLRIANLNAKFPKWTTSTEDIKKGDKVKLCVYYHNSSTIIAKNTKIVLSFDNGKIKSTISADNFNEYVSSLNIAQNIEIENIAEWYHDYNRDYEIESMVLKDGLKINLGDVKSGYMPNDGYIVFTGIVK